MHVESETEKNSTQWAYECQNNRCVRVEAKEKESLDAVSLGVCRIFCNEEPGTLWPMVNGKIQLKNVMARITPKELQFSINQTTRNGDFWKANEERLRKQILAKVPKSVKLNDDGGRLTILVDVASDDSPLNLETNEHYHIRATEKDGIVTININAENQFGARHALETISQLIVYDNIRGELQTVAEYEIDDKPAFAHRGLLLDTSRNYYSVDSIKRTLGESRIKILQ